MSESLHIESNQIENLKKMLQIRHAERLIAKGRENGQVGGPVHLGAGQEAIAVGVSGFLTKYDFVFSAHRSHAHLISLGSPIRKLFAEVLGRSTGLSRGMGGSMHLIDVSNGFYGSTPIVAGTVPLAVGAALSAKSKGANAVAVSYFGDGAMEEGIVHESLNFASRFRLPILFVCENNFFSSHLHISLRQPQSSVARFGVANDIPTLSVDGNDLLSVQEATKKLIQNCRSGRGPGFLEANTFRHYGHVDWREDIDVGVNRSEKDLALWRGRDPILRLKNELIESGLSSREAILELESNIVMELEKDWNLALADPFPEIDQVMQSVFADRSGLND